MFKNLTPRSIAALAVVAASFFLTMCVARYGGAEFANARAAQSAGPAAHLSGWLVQNIGAGVWALLLLPLTWGAIVYFEERTPDLVLRLVGTVILAVSISTLVGLVQGGLWAGHVGNGVAGALGGLKVHLGAFGTGIAFLLTLSLFGVSTIFATDWMFHSLRRAGRVAADAEAATTIATEPAAAELLESPAEAEPREFLAQTPRAAVAAAEMDDIVSNSSVEVSTPAGWDETEDEGRTVIAAPAGYRGVEFLPPSDELAIPGAPSATAQSETTAAESDAPRAPSIFSDEEFVTTSDAAFFLETGEDAAAWDVDLAETAPAAEEPEEDPVVAEAVETLFAAVTQPAESPAAAPASGIGLPADSPFLDEFFPSQAGWPFAEEPAAAPSDGASAASDMMAARFVAPPAPAAEPVASAAEIDESPAFEDEVVSFGSTLASRLPADAFDDSLPVQFETTETQAAQTETVTAEVEPVEPSASVITQNDADTGTETAPVIEVAEPVVVEVAAPVVAATEEPAVAEEPITIVTASPAAEPAPQLSLFSEPAPAEFAPSASAVATLPEVNLALLHTMELDPLFRDAVAAVLERGRASAVVLQRQLGIGYARGIRILDQMTTAGLVGPDTPTGSREIRVSREAWAAFAA